MQDPATFPAPARFPEEKCDVIKCPRCDSPETKFCYYNNYNLSQPRHFCKNCRRYWTKGGALRNVPVGGRARKKGKRPGNPDPTRTRRALQVCRTSSMGEGSGSGPDPERFYGFFGGQDRKILDVTGSFGLILASSGQFGSLREGLNPNGSSSEMVELGRFGEELDGDGSGMESDPTQSRRAMQVSSTGSMVEESGSEPDPERFCGFSGGHDRKILDVTGSFGFILASSGQFGSLWEGLDPNGSGSKMVKLGDFGEVREELDGDGSGMESDPIQAMQVSSTSSMVEDSGLGPDPGRLYGFSDEEGWKMPDVTVSFGSLLASSGQFGSLREGLNPNGYGSKMVKLGNFGEELDGDGLGMDLDPTRTRPTLSSTSSMVEDSCLGPDPGRVYRFSGEQDRKMLDVTGSFSSIMASSGQFGSLREGMHPDGSGSKMVKMSDFGEELDGDGSGMDSDPGRCSGLDEQSNDGSESFVWQSGESSFWPDLGVYTRGSCFQ